MRMVRAISPTDFVLFLGHLLTRISQKSDKNDPERLKTHKVPSTSTQPGSKRFCWLLPNTLSTPSSPGYRQAVVVQVVKKRKERPMPCPHRRRHHRMKASNPYLNSWIKGNKATMPSERDGAGTGISSGCMPII